MKTRPFSLLAVSCGLLAALTMPPLLRSSALPDRTQLAAAGRDAWNVETVDSQPYVGLYSSLALDDDGYPHISYFDDANDALKYAYKDAGGWHIETVETIGWAGGEFGAQTSLALDHQGRPHISYLYAPTVDLRHAYRDSSDWQSGTPILTEIRGELRPQSEDFHTGTLPLQDRPRTSAQASWTITGTVAGTVDSPDIAPVIQEIVGQAGWRPGNNLAILVDANRRDGAYVDWRAYDAFPTQAAQLLISYEWSGQPPPTWTPSPTASPTKTQTPTPTRSPTPSATPTTTASPTASTTPTAAPAPSNTPTPSPTPSATAPPASRRVYLPVIVR